MDIVLDVALLEKTVLDFILLSFSLEALQILFRVPRIALHEWVVVVKNRVGSSSENR